MALKTFLRHFAGGCANIDGQQFCNMPVSRNASARSSRHGLIGQQNMQAGMVKLAAAASAAISRIMGRH